MEVLSASVEAVINTFSAVKSDQINLWHKVVDGHYMDERLGHSKSMGSLLKDMIEAYNNCVSEKHRIQVRCPFIHRC